MLTVYRNMFRIRDLRNKILFTLFIFLIYRLGTAIPVPGVDLDAVKEFAEQGEQGGHRLAQAALRSPTRCGTSRTEASAAAWSALTGRAGICFSAPSSPAS